jgi:DNA polymerase-3 subunit epsilon
VTFVANWAEEAATALQATGDFRVLRRVRLDEGPTGEDASDAFVAAVVDVETTGLSHSDDQIIELAIRRVRCSSSGRVIEVGRQFAWLEDPGRPLSPEIIRITGLTDHMLAGAAIDDAQAVSVLRSASMIITHNAAFDRPFVEDRLPGANGLCWACSCREVDWPGLGFDGRALGWLLMQAGWFHEGHRAHADVDALIALLRHELGEGRTPLTDIVESSGAPSWLIRAVGAHFDVKDRLKCRGYRWDGIRSVWWKEVKEDERDLEQVWLLNEIYDPRCRPRAAGPEFQAVTAQTRYTRT